MVIPRHSVAEIKVNTHERSPNCGPVRPVPRPRVAEYPARVAAGAAGEAAPTEQQDPARDGVAGHARVRASVRKGPGELLGPPAFPPHPRVREVRRATPALRWIDRATLHPGPGAADEPAPEQRGRLAGPGRGGEPGSEPAVRLLHPVPGPVRSVPRPGGAEPRSRRHQNGAGRTVVANVAVTARMVTAAAIPRFTPCLRGSGCSG
jgi:hypothetical protein